LGFRDFLEEGGRTDWTGLFTSTANNELLYGFGKAMHRDVIDAESINDLFPVYLAEHFVVDRPDLRTVAERAVFRTHDKFL
jgi:hypothetical protein